MNAPLRRVALAAFVLFGLLVANANYVQVFRADALRKDPGNTRVLQEEYERQRGSIVAEDGTPLASSVATSDRLRYLRKYSGGPAYAPLTGIYSLIYGATGIEQADNDILTGNDNRLFTRRLSDLLTGRDPKGGNVRLTVDRRAQAAAYAGLAKQRGAVVALDPASGKILAMASAPSYDPNLLSSHDPAAIRAAATVYAKDPDQPRLNRAISQNYPPGSTFKVVVSAAALQNGRTPDSTIDCPSAYKLPQSRSVLNNFNDEPCSGSKVTLTQALTNSYNTAFAKLGVDLGSDALRRQAAAFGITDSGFGTPLPVADSSVGDIPDDASLAQSSIGQRDVRLTPLQGAMIAAAVANSGRLMRPYLVDRLEATDLSVLDQTKPVPLNPDAPDAVPPSVAEQLTAMMKSVVDRGTGTAAQIPGTLVAGKTGTAENATGRQPHAWFIGFAKRGDRSVAVAVLIENGGNSGRERTGGEAAAPVAKSVMQAVLDAPGGG